MKGRVINDEDVEGERGDERGCEGVEGARKCNGCCC